MTGYEIRNAIRRAYGFDAADHLFEHHDNKRSDDRSALIRMLTVIAVAMKGVL